MKCPLLSVICVVSLCGSFLIAADSVVPEKDPQPEGKILEIVAPVRGKHPRLLLSAETLPQLHAFYKSDAGKPWREKLEAYLQASSAPKDTKFLTDATDAQRQGLWKLPTASLHYVLTGDKASFAKAKAFLDLFLSLPDWETGEERNSGMGAANIMIGAALAYDWLYNDLDPEFRQKFRDKLLWHARYMYYGGHLMKNPGTHYWQNDPANNHRWHRNAGLTLAVLATHENKPEEQWLLQQTVKELQFVNDWLPRDGTSHEGPVYLTFGGNHLVLAMDAADRCMGAHFLQAPYYKSTGIFRAHLLLPGMDGVFLFGDANAGGLGGYNNFFLKGAAINRQPDVKDALYRLLEKDPSAYEFGWFSLLWDDPSLARGELDKMPTYSFWPDIGFATMRSSWKADAIAASFKCGPFGGYELNRFAEENKTYINVAHDDPDANEFLIAMGGEMVVKTDGYSSRKASRNHNTILVNGLGQMSKGRPEGGQYSQPARNGVSMSQMGVITAYQQAGEMVAVEGEASGSYLEYKDKTGSRPALDRFRRTFLWVKNQYILVLDDIRAPEEVNIDWLIQSEALEAVNPTEGRFVLKAKDKNCTFQIVSDKPMTFVLQDSPADNRGKSLGYRQLKASSKVSALRVASVYNPWQKQVLSVRLETGADPDQARVFVEGEGIKDVWNWKAGKERFTASTMEGTGGSPGLPFRMDASNSQPPLGSVDNARRF